MHQSVIKAQEKQNMDRAEKSNNGRIHADPDHAAQANVQDKKGTERSRKCWNIEDPPFFC